MTDMQRLLHELEELRMEKINLSSQVSELKYEKSQLVKENKELKKEVEVLKKNVKKLYIENNNFKTQTYVAFADAYNWT